MHEYALTFARSARRELERLDTTVIARVLPRIEALVDEPRPSGCRKLRGSKNLWRIRIGDYRVIYEVDDALAAVTVLNPRPPARRIPVKLEQPVPRMVAGL